MRAKRKFRDVGCNTRLYFFVVSLFSGIKSRWIFIITRQKKLVNASHSGFFVLLLAEKKWTCSFILGTCQPPNQHPPPSRPTHAQPVLFHANYFFPLVLFRRSQNFFYLFRQDILGGGRIPPYKLHFFGVAARNKVFKLFLYSMIMAPFRDTAINSPTF